MYEDGTGVRKDLQTAYMWYYLAHLCGNENAEERLMSLNTDKTKISEAQITEAKIQAQKKFDKIKNIIDIDILIDGLNLENDQ